MYSKVNVSDQIKFDRTNTKISQKNVWQLGVIISNADTKLLEEILKVKL